MGIGTFRENYTLYNNRENFLDLHQSALNRQGAFLSLLAPCGVALSCGTDVTSDWRELSLWDTDLRHLNWKL